jgi:hypothetical protein
MKTLAILAVLFAFTQAPIPVPPQTPNNNGNVSNDSQHKSGNGKTPPAKPTPKEAKSDNLERNSKQPGETDTKESVTITEFAAVPSKRDWVDYAALGISFLLAVVTVTGVIAAWRGLPGILQQAKAAEDAALAAKKSADSQINIERPWLLFEQLEVPRYMRVGFDQPTKLIGTFKCVVCNYGKTPARVLALKVRLILGDSSDLPPDPTEIFDRQDFAVNPHIIPQNQNRPLEEQVFPRGSFTDREDNDIATSKIFVWALGVVRYADVHGGSYETRICYRYNFSKEELILDGPPEYNNAT